MMFSLSLITEPEELKVGMDVFKVYALGSASRVDHWTVDAPPYEHVFLDGERSLFVPATHHYDAWDCKDKFSLADSNVVTNDYNHHKLFFDRAAAEAYLDNCKILHIDLPHRSRA